MNKKVESGEVKRLGRPRYAIKSMYDGRHKGYLIVLKYVNVEDRPYHRFVSSLEQSVEELNDDFSYVVFVGSPYDNVGFKIDNKRLRKRGFLEYFDEQTKNYYLQFFLEDEQE
jgi:splicing factor 3A subunit 2